MLHTAGRCRPSYSFTRFSKDGTTLLNRGPIDIAKGNDLRYVAMSEGYATSLEHYIESLAIEPLIKDRGFMADMEVIGSSAHTGVQVWAVEPALAEWNALHVNSRATAVDYASREIDSRSGPSPVLHYPGYAFIKETHVNSLSGGMAIIVYYVFRKELGRTTLIGVRAGMRAERVFDPCTTGPFFTEEALNTLFDWHRETINEHGHEITVSTLPTAEEMQTEYFKERYGR